MLHSAEIEAAVIGAILVEGDGALDIAQAELSAEDFYFPEHREIYEACTFLQSSGATFSILGVHDMLMRLEWYKRKEGNLQWLTEMSDSSGIHALKYHCQRLVEIADRRRLMERLELAQEKLKKGDAVEECKGTVDGVKLREKTQLVSAKEIAEQIELEDPFSAKADRGVSTGLATLDNILTFRGIVRGNITVIGAASSKGKSSLSSQIGDHAASHGMNVLDITLEDDAISRANRTISRLSGIENTRVQRGQIAPDEEPAYMRAKDKLSAMNLWYLPIIPKNSTHLCGIIKRFSYTAPLDLVIVDYLQLIPPKSRGSKLEQTDESLLDIVQLARNMPNTAFILVSQLRKTDQDKAPGLEDLYHSNAINQWAHTIMLIYAPQIDIDKYPAAANCRNVNIKKQKNGIVGDIIMGWNGETVCFCEPRPSDAADYKSAILDMASNSKYAR